MNLPFAITSFANALKKHSPEILAGLGITGLITAGVVAVKKTPTALIKIDERKDELNTDKLPPKEIIRTAWKCYAPSVILAAISTTCIIGSTVTNSRRNAALATLYSLSESKLREYTKEVAKSVGPEKEQEIKKAADTAPKIISTPIKDIIRTGDGDELCYDVVSARYFYSSVNAIHAAANKINEQVNNTGEATVNDYYDFINLPHTSVGNNLGWDLDHGLMRVRDRSDNYTDGRSVYVPQYDVAPTWFR